MVEKKTVEIAAPNLKTVEMCIVGTTPLCINQFSNKSKERMKGNQEAGSQGGSKKTKREAKDFNQCYEDAKHVSQEGWCGFPASAIRTAMVDACRLVNFKMTIAKLSVFVKQDGYDRVDGVTGLVRIHGEPKMIISPMRNATGVFDLRARPVWDPGWKARLKIIYDADQFMLQDVANLLMRVGSQVGIGEGRPNSRSSTGCGWGLFDLES